MNIYFAGAIRGGRDDSHIYGFLISHLRQFGSVLTEHVGNEALLKDENKLTENEIFDRDMEWLGSSDVVIAEVTTPSLGVGYELGVAQGLGKPVLCLFQADSKTSLSAMVKGNNVFAVREYQSIQDACDIMDQFIANLGQN